MIKNGQSLSSAEKNLRSWLSTHRLPTEFPLLNEATESDGDIYLRNEGEQIKEVLDRIQGSPRTIIRFVPGQGATTILRETIREATEARARGLNIFLEINIAEIAEDDNEDSTKKFPRILLMRIYDQLLNGYWEDRLYAERKAHLFDVMEVADEQGMRDLRVQYDDHTEAVQKDARLHGHTLNERHINMCNFEPLQRFLRKNRKTVGGLLVTIHSKMNISSFVVFDLPSDTDEEDIRGVTRAMKSFDQKYMSGTKAKAEAGDNAVHLPAALSEVYFMPDMLSGLMISMWQRDFQIYDFPAYNNAEVFQILASRFHPRLRNENIPLSSVFSDQFVERAHNSRGSLESMSKEIRGLMLEALNLTNSNIPFSLSPKAIEYKDA